MSSLKQIEEDLKSFRDFCKDLKLSQQEIAKICAPLAPSPFPKPRNVLLLLLLVLAAYYLFQVESISWHLSAIGRIALIKILPFYDWQVWKNARCLVQFPKASVVAKECYYCESLTSVAFSKESDGEFLKKNYLDFDVPVVLAFPAGKFNSSEDFLQEILQDSAYGNSEPCRVATNLKQKTSVHDLLIQTSLSKYFLQYQNCEFSAVKSFRKFLRRPEFFHATAAPNQYSWLILSRNYRVKQFRTVKLREALIGFVQLFGRNLVRLRATGGCDDEVCEMLEVALQEGDVLLFGAGWNLEYRPLVEEEDEGVESVAVVLETRY